MPVKSTLQTTTNQVKSVPLMYFIGQPFELKFRYALKLYQEDGKRARVESIIVYDHDNSLKTISVSRLLKTAKFYGPTRMVPGTVPLGEKIIRVRDLLFIDAQLTITTDKDSKWTLSDKNGFLKLVVATSDFRNILTQLNTKTNG